MADTFGGLIDKLITIDMKMWNNQELLYEIRRMTFDEYKQKYFLNEDGSLIIYLMLYFYTYLLKKSIHSLMHHMHILMIVLVDMVYRLESYLICFMFSLYIFSRI